jgi:hypothetical protein
VIEFRADIFCASDMVFGTTARQSVSRYVHA